MTIRFIASTGLGALLLSGCAPVDPSFGEAVAWNKAVQTINPDGTPAAAGAAEPGASADVAVNSAEAYREGAVERASVSSQGGSGTGGGGSTGGQGNPPR